MKVDNYRIQFLFYRYVQHKRTCNDSYLSRPFLCVVGLNIFDRTAFFVIISISFYQISVKGDKNKIYKINLIRCQKCCKDHKFDSHSSNLKRSHVSFVGNKFRSTLTGRLKGSNKNFYVISLYLARKALVTPRDLHKSSFLKWKNHTQKLLSPFWFLVNSDAMM